jgi:L-lactate dehydrogenase (cytochrome)/(S)-mandelate dehydrogenase
MKFERALNLEDLRLIARRKLPKIAFDFVDGGVHDEELLEQNRAVFRRYALLPRYLVDVSVRDQSVELFGRTYASPFAISPMGVAGFMQPGADRMMARAAQRADIPYVMSSASCDSLETAKKEAPDVTWFQIYGTRDPQITDDLVRRAARAAVEVLVLTIDTPTLMGRERNSRNGFSRPVKMTPRIIVQGLLRPAWTIAYLRNRGTPMMENWAPYLSGGTADQIADLYGRETPAPQQTWATFERVRANWKGKLLLKGVLHPLDAAKGVDLGADGLIVSNHGGRQFDRAPSPLEVLPLIRQAVGPSIVLGYDSGIRRGSDLVVAKCLGADFGMTGRPFMFAAVAGGEAGVDKAIAILRAEVDHSLAQLGQPRFTQMTSDILFDRQAARSISDDPPSMSC